MTEIVATTAVGTGLLGIAGYWWYRVRKRPVTVK